MAERSEPAPRRCELMAMVSLAADIGMAQPVETGLAVCVVATRLAGRLGLDDDTRQRAHQLALLQHIGCTAAATTVAALLGDEMEMRRHAATLDFADSREMLRFLLGHVSRVHPLPARPLGLARAIVNGRRMTDTVVDVCEAARMLGARFGFGEAFLGDLDVVYERWDGAGFPGRAAGEQISVPVQVVQVATLAVNALRVADTAAAVELVRARRGRALAPAAATALIDEPTGILGGMQEPGSLWDRVIGSEPSPAPEPTGEEVDHTLRAIADFVDLKSPWFAGHSPGVAELAATAAQQWGLSAEEVRTVRRAGWLHDVGRLGVSSRVWDHPGPLGPNDREQVRLHPYHTDRVLDRTPFLRRLGAVASGHHERLDGSGYFRGSTTAQLSRGARVLAAADTFHAMTEPRPQRPALPPSAAAAQLRAEVTDGRLDGAAVDAVLAAAGHGSGRRRRHTTDGLTPREVQILAQLARGSSIKQIARQLGIAPKTVDGHIQRIYAKVNVSTRAGAALYAMQHNLLEAEETAGQDREISP